jgi:hypothetical protein
VFAGRSYMLCSCSAVGVGPLQACCLKDRLNTGFLLSICCLHAAA